jgi:hypothetical protein
MYHALTHQCLGLCIVLAHVSLAYTAIQRQHVSIRYRTDPIIVSLCVLGKYSISPLCVLHQ